MPADPNAMDPEAWLDAHGDYLFAYAMSRVDDTQVAEDLVQETLLAALGSMASFQGRSTVRTWLGGILRHKILDHYRKSRRRPPHAEQEVEDAFVDSLFTSSGKWQKNPAAWGAEPDALLASEEFRDVLRHCLKRLPGRSQESLLLLERQDLSHETIGQVLNISTTHVGVLLHRARHALRVCLERHWFDPPEEHA